METEIDPDAHGEDDDDDGYGAELDAEQLANNAGSDEAEKEKNRFRRKLSGEIKTLTR